jgi:hypothetical protein
MISISFLTQCLNNLFLISHSLISDLFAIEDSSARALVERTSLKDKSFSSN